MACGTKINSNDSSGGFYNPVHLFFVGLTAPKPGGEALCQNGVSCARGGGGWVRGGRPVCKVVFFLMTTVMLAQKDRQPFSDL